MEIAEGRSRDCEVVVLKTRRLVRKDALLNGMMRFSLLLEICQPATLPHPHLLAASLDLVFFFFLNKMSHHIYEEKEN